MGSWPGLVLLFFAVLPVWAASIPETGTAAKRPTILVIGDSLSAAYRIDAGRGWVSLMQQRLDRISTAGWQVINGSISGDTTRGGLSRLPRALEEHVPDVVIIELGGNDGLRGVSLEETRRNLEAILQAVTEYGAKVLIAEMRLPTNYGPAYTEKFRSMYHELAAARGAILIPFLLDGVANDPVLMQDDGIHPRAEAQEIILNNVWPYVEAVL